MPEQTLGRHDLPLSRTSGRVKESRRLLRRSERAEAGAFLVEGAKAIAEAQAVPGCVREVFATTLATTRRHDLYAATVEAGACWRLVDDEALGSLSDTVTPQGLVAVCRMIDRPLDEVLAPAPRLVAVCADVRDPGNAGTVIRCADAVGADAVVLAGHSVDAYNPKTVRATVGSLFHLPLCLVEEPADAMTRLRAAGVQVLAADAAGERDLFEADDLLSAPTAWLFGNEAWGLPDDLAGLADERVRIPIHGRAESLNLSTAAAVCLYASARARRLS